MSCQMNCIGDFFNQRLKLQSTDSLTTQPVSNAIGMKREAWGVSDVSQMREVMKTEEWHVFGSCCWQAEPAQQYQLNREKYGS